MFVGSSISAKNSEEISAISKKFTKLYKGEDISAKMVKINVESFSEEALRKLFNDLSRKESWDAECETCRMPEMLHKGPYTRKTEVMKLNLQIYGKHGDGMRMKWRKGRTIVS